MRIDVQAVVLAEVVRARVEGMRLAAEAKSITLEEIIDPRVDSVAGDPDRLQQVVWNLASNAVKFTSTGGKIQVRVERQSHVEIIVADTGQGIEPAVLDSVFDRFWQGSVTAHSEGSGKGSTFTVRLPLSMSTICALEPRTIRPWLG
jgi:signal transduction histidine kinase